jgi:hypothetical protein
MRRHSSVFYHATQFSISAQTRTQEDRRTKPIRAEPTRPLRKPEQLLLRQLWQRQMPDTFSRAWHNWFLPYLYHGSKLTCCYCCMGFTAPPRAEHSSKGWDFLLPFDILELVQYNIGNGGAGYLFCIYIYMRCLYLTTFLTTSQRSWDVVLRLTF